MLPRSHLNKELHPHIREIGVQPTRAATLDGLGHLLPDGPVDVMKVDVEGFERQVLHGGRRFLPERVRFLIMELAVHRDNFWRDQTYIDVLLLLRDFGFALHNIFDIQRHALGIVQMDCVFRNTHFGDCQHAVVDRASGMALQSATLPGQDLASREPRI